MFIRHNQSSRDFNDDDTALRLFVSHKIDFKIHDISPLQFMKKFQEKNWKYSIQPNFKSNNKCRYFCQRHDSCIKFLNIMVKEIF